MNRARMVNRDVTRLSIKCDYLTLATLRLVTAVNQIVMRQICASKYQETVSSLLKSSLDSIGSGH